jgi:WS/DGAT/MGAT family acyltransferase
VGEHLTPLDATFLELEQADQCAHMHIGALLVFDPREDGSVPGFGEVCGRLEPRIHQLRHFSDRLSQPKVGGISWPEWVADKRFDVHAHIQHVTLPSPGGDDELREWASEYYSQRLDRARPLWEMAVIDGLAGGRWAVATKTHHALVDGVGSVDTAYVLLDTERHPETDPGEDAGAGTPTPAARGAADTLRSATRIAAMPLRVAARALDAAIHPGKAADGLRRARAAVRLLIEDEMIRAPRTSLNDPIGGKRSLALVRSDLAELKAIKNDLGGTVNDVVLAAMAGGLRRLLLARGETPPDAGLRAMVPVNVRQASEQLALGNKITSLFIHLPVAEADVADRYRAQLAEAGARKGSDQALGSTTVVDLASLAPPILHGVLAQSLFATRLFNVTITNIPGPQQPLYALGGQLREVWPLVPLAAEHALGLAVLSYDGTLYFCINADRDSVPDLEVLRTGIEESIEELAELARSRRTTAREPVPVHHAEVHEVRPG